MNSSDYLDSNPEYETLYPQTVMDSDSRDSSHQSQHSKKPHFYSHNNSKHFECFCGKIFISKADYNRHMLVHTGERPHECDVCGKAFSLKGNLTKHVLLHTDEKAYHCTECGKSFLKKNYIDQHMRVHTGEKPFVCPHCHRAFSLKGNLAQHMKLHTDEKSYHCLECNKLFLKKSYLLQHMRVHSGDKPHKCNLCSRAFNLKGNLVQHMKRHSGRKPFKCLECDKSFALKGALKEHEKVHGGEKPFACNVCSKSFNKKAYLTQHERTHTGERPFQCLECGKSFSQRSILNQHMKQHGERSYKCSQCHKVFLKKLSEINKALRSSRFSGFRCPACDGTTSPSGETISGVLLKQEHPISGYDPQYIPDDNVSLYNLDHPQKSDELEKLKLKIARMEGDFGTASKSNGTIESNGLTERLYDFDTDSMLPTMVANPTETRKFMDYNQKKVAVANALFKENSKKSSDNQNITGCGTSSQGTTVSGELLEQHKKYTELKVVEKHRLPKVAIANSATGSSNLLGKNGLSYTPMGGSVTQKVLPVNEERKLQSHGQQGEDKSRYQSGKTMGGSIGQKNMVCTGGVSVANSGAAGDSSTNKKSIGKNIHNNVRNNTSSGKSMEYNFKKHPALMGIDSQSSSAEANQRSDIDGNDARRALLYSQSTFSDYNARYYNLGFRHGNVPEMENALSRFGIKGYYSAPWSFAGNYPE